MGRPSRTRAAAAAAGLALALSGGGARAQGLTAPNVGTSASGPATLDPAAVHWNPGLLGFLDEPTMLGGLGLVVGDLRYRRERRALYQREDSFDFALPLDPSSADPAKTGRAPEARATPVAPLGSLFAALPLVPGRLVAALGVYTPYAALASFEPGGAQRWAVEEALVTATYVTPSIAFRAHETLSVGAGVSYVRGLAEIARVNDFASVPELGRALGGPPINQANDFGPDAPPGVRELDVMSRRFVLQGAWANALTFNAGLAFRPDARTLAGLSYQHGATMNYNGRFQLDMNDSFFTNDLASKGLRFKPRVEGDATLTVPLPPILRAGARRELGGDTALALSLTYAFWSRVRSFDVLVRSPDLAMPELGLGDTYRLSLPRRWNDTFGAELALFRGLGGPWRLWGVAGYHSPASPDETIDVASPDGHRLVGAVGAGYALGPKLSLLGDFEAQAILPRRVVNSDYDLGNGLYNLRVFALGLYVRASL
ncbi:MAG TPA: outer membrane protein transport protein [Polyangiaceae bacterium]|nr:outer membrane protein transport protein [Polyangiaceae bacterium]